MSAALIYRFNYIAPNSEVHLFSHGWSVRQAVNFSIVVYAQRGEGVNYPMAHATIREGETYMHVDGTVARKVYIRNHAPFNGCTVDVVAQWQNF